MRVRPRLKWVESRNRHVLEDVPEALVAPPDGTRTTVFAVLLRPPRRDSNSNDSPAFGQVFCCSTQRLGQQVVLIIADYFTDATGESHWLRTKKSRPFLRKLNAVPSSRQCSLFATRTLPWT